MTEDSIEGPKLLVKVAYNLLHRCLITHAKGKVQKLSAVVD